jgi:TPR repeat protein
MGPPPGFPTRSLSPTNVADATSPLSPGRSRDENNAEVQYQIGLSLMYGTGHTDPQKALAWFRKAAEQKHILAMYHLGHGLWKSPGVQHDLPLAREWLTRAANLNCTFAQNSLAQLLARSEKSDERQQALRWFEKAAEAGLPEAKANLGTMYAVGFLVQKDEARALGLTKQAAEGGLTSAMQQLGSWYEKGIGTAKDLEEAARWYQRAARAGNPQAQEALERLQSGCAVCGQKTEKRCLACGVVRAGSLNSVAFVLVLCWQRLLLFLAISSLRFGIAVRSIRRPTGPRTSTSVARSPPVAAALPLACLPRPPLVSPPRLVLPLEALCRLLRLLLLLRDLRWLDRERRRCPPRRRARPVQCKRNNRTT